MTLRGLVVTIALLAAGSAASAGAAQPTSDLSADHRLARLELWLKILARHQPGILDEGLLAAGSWSNVDLGTLQLDASAIVRLIRNPELLAESKPVVFAFKPEGQPTAQTFRYTSIQLRRIKQLACAAGGLLDEPSCEWVGASIVGDPDLGRLHRLASTGRRAGDNNVVLRRGALLHADVAILGVAAPVEAMAFGTSSPGQSIRVRISDGRQTSLTQSSAHWEIARKLLDMVSAPGSSKAAPGSDEMVRLWYVATATWMEHQGQHDNRHLARGREIFSDDADLLFLTGAQHATYAGPPIQTAVRSAFLPTGIKIDVSSERSELRDAERYFRRAVDVRPEFAEAHLRLGRVLALTDRNADAARELGRALELADEPLLVYYGTLFLGAVQETLGQNEAARASYERAAALYPRAQSPRLALSELARRAGNRDVALREIEKVFNLRSDGQRDADPWWVYDMTQGRHAGTLLDLLRKPFRSGDRP